MSSEIDAGFRPDIELLTARLASRLRAQGHPWPQMAALALRDRAATELDRSALAAVTGLDEERMTVLETGGPP